MQEKYMVTDSLACINAELEKFGNMIAQTDNKQLKQTLKTFRDNCEKSQEELYEMARSKNYYIPAQQATSQEIQRVKGLFTAGM
jgi:spore coat protein CotF